MTITHRAVLLGGAMALATGLTACGSGGDDAAVTTATTTTTEAPGTVPGTVPPGTAPQPVREALGSLCARLDGIGDILGDVDRITDVPGALDRAADQLQGVEDDLSALEDAAMEPRSPAVQQVIDATRAGVRKMGDAAGAALTGDTDRASDLVDDARRDFDQARTEAAELGADRCSMSTGTTAPGSGTTRPDR